MTILLQEDFTGSWTGWYDGTAGSIDTTVFSPFGGAESVRFSWGVGQDQVTGVNRRKLITPTDRAYVQFDWKFGTAGVPWQGSGVSFHPHIVQLMSQPDNDFAGPASSLLNCYLEVGSVSGGNSVLRTVLQDSLRINAAQLDVDLLGTATNHATGGYNGIQSQATPTLVDKFGGNSNYTFWDTPGRPILNNTWHRIRAYWQMNTIVSTLPQPDGIMRFWVDNVLVLERTNVYFRTNQHPTMMWDQFIIAPYIGNGSPIAQDMWMDNLIIADSLSDFGATDLSLHESSWSSLSARRGRRMISEW